MWIDILNGVLQVESRFTRGWMEKPQPCAWCATLCTVFVNRDGETRCWSCDEGYQQTRVRG